jgi:hypothetical protein
MLDVFMSGQDSKSLDILQVNARAKLHMEEFLRKNGLTLALVAEPESTASPEPESQPALVAEPESAASPEISLFKQRCGYNI